MAAATTGLLALATALTPAPVLADPTNPVTGSPGVPPLIADPPPATHALSLPERAPSTTWSVKPTVPDVLALHSRPGSSHTVYLNVVGEDMTGSDWTSLPDAPSGYLARPADFDGSAGFTTRERGFIELVWRHVSEDFAPFDIDVTTQRPSPDALQRSSRSDTTFGTTVVLTDEPWLKRACDGCTGIASLGVFDGVGTDACRRAVVFPAYFVKTVLPSFGPAFAARLLGTTVSHEIGHHLGLRHDALLPTSPIGSLLYHPGFSPGGPIMGSTAQPVTRWADTSVPFVDNTEDDLAVLEAELGLVPDEPSLVPLTTGTPRRGTLATGADSDAYTYRATRASTVLATVDGAFADLDLALTLLDDLGRTTVHSPPARATSWAVTGLGASARLLAGRTYRITLSPASTPGMGAYGSLGRYTLVVREE